MYGVPTLNQVVAACREPGVFRLTRDLLGTNLGKKAKLPGYFWGTSSCSPSIIHARSAAAHLLSAGSRPHRRVTVRPLHHRSSPSAPLHHRASPSVVHARGTVGPRPPHIVYGPELVSNTRVGFFSKIPFLTLSFHPWLDPFLTCSQIGCVNSCSQKIANFCSDSFTDCFVLIIFDV
jgi:hypothetical protein